MQALPNVASLPALAIPEKTRVLDLLFEPCTQLHELSLSLLQSSAFDSYNSLISAVGQQMAALAASPASSDSSMLEGILSAHPRLGETKVDSQQSSAEQAQLHAGGEEQIQALAECNRDYEEAFPGLRYVVFVNGRSRPVIMEDMRARIHRADPAMERQDAIQAMCDIANDRAQKLGQSA